MKIKLIMALLTYLLLSHSFGATVKVSDIKCSADDMLPDGKRVKVVVNETKIKHIKNHRVYAIMKKNRKGDVEQFIMAIGPIRSYMFDFKLENFKESINVLIFKYDRNKYLRFACRLERPEPSEPLQSISPKDTGHRP